MIKIAIIGATGYTGRESIALLLNHPDVEITHLFSLEYVSESIARVFPQFLNRIDLTIQKTDLDVVAKNCNTAFLCVPHTASMEIAAELLRKKVKVIDFSADYRFSDAEIYNRTYATKHKHPELLKEAAYGIPEIYRDEIKECSLLANPGCYPTGAILAAAPLLKNKIVKNDGIIIDSKSGVSGAGRTPNPKTVFSECNESVEAYSVGKHRHQPEIEQEFSKLYGADIKVTFVPHLIPMTRGILSTLYFNTVRDFSVEEVHQLYDGFFRNDYFVRVLDVGSFPKTADVANTNCCHIGLAVTGEKKLVVVSAIDNLIKGASGQAVQCMNIMFGLDEKKGLV